MLVRRAVVAVRKGRALARLALARRRPAPRRAAVERASLDLLGDERDGRADSLLDDPSDLRLRPDWEVAADVLEERAVRLREIERVAGQALHRVLACREDGTAILGLRVGRDVRIDEVFDRAINRP